MVFSLVSRLLCHGLLRLVAARQWKGRVRCLLDIFMMPHAGSYSLTFASLEIMVVSDLRPTMQPGLHDRNSEPARLMLGLLPDVQICSMHNVGETEDIALDAALHICTRLGSIVQLGSTRHIRP